VDSKLRRGVKLVIFLCFILVFAYLLYSNWQAVKVTLIDHFIAILYATALSVIAISAQAVNFLQLLDSSDKPAYAPMLRIWALSNLANYIAPLQPGLAVRLVSLRRHGISIWIVTRTTVRQLQLSIWAAIGLAAVGGMFSSMLVIKTMAVLSAAVFILWPVLLRLVYILILDKCANITFVRKHRGELVTMLTPVSLSKFILPVVQYLLIALSIFVVYRTFGAELFLHDAILIAVAIVLSALFSITPSNFGIQEALLGYSAHVVGLSVNDAISIAVLYRLAHLGACGTILLLTIGAPRHACIK